MSEILEFKFSRQDEFLIKRKESEEVLGKMIHKIYLPEALGFSNVLGVNMYYGKEGGLIHKEINDNSKKLSEKVTDLYGPHAHMSPTPVKKEDAE